MIVFYENFQIETFYSETHQLWFPEISLATETDFRFHEYEWFAGSEFECLFNSMKACLLICQEQAKPDFLLAEWIPMDDVEF